MFVCFAFGLTDRVLLVFSLIVILCVCSLIFLLFMWRLVGLVSD